MNDKERKLLLLIAQQVSWLESSQPIRDQIEQLVTAIELDNKPEPKFRDGDAVCFTYRNVEEMVLIKGEPVYSLDAWHYSVEGKVTAVPEEMLKKI